MADLLLKSDEDVRDFVRGCTFNGTRGGGDSALGLRVLLEDLRRSGEIRISDVDSVNDEAWVCTPFRMGSIASKSPEKLARMSEAGLSKRIGMAEHMLVSAVQELQRYLDVDIDVLVPIELGGANTPMPVDAAVSLGKRVVNGDYAGRAIPEISQITPCLVGKPSHPTTCVDEWGNITIVKTAVNYHLAASLGKMISVAAFGSIRGAGFLMRGKEMKETLIRNTLGECLLVGQTIRRAIAKGRDPADDVAAAVKGWVIFRGKVVRKEWQDRDGYLWGTNTVEGKDGFNGRTLEIFLKNENHIC